MTREKREEPDSSVIRWISPEWLEAHLQDPGLVVADCRPEGRLYCSGHIPGAIHLNEALLRMHIGRLPARWIPAGAARHLLGTLGIGAESPVAVYTGCGKDGVLPHGPCGDGLEAPLVAYSLVRFGCRRVMILDGGLDLWRAEGRLVSQEPGVTRPSGFTVAVPIHLFIGYDECARLKDDPDVVLLDARPEARYKEHDPQGGAAHIPFAVSLPASLLLDPVNPARLKPEREIRAILSGLGVTPEKTVICASGTGKSAAAVFVVLKWFLGYPDVVMFEGGFAEWVSRTGDGTMTRTAIR